MSGQFDTTIKFKYLVVEKLQEFDTFLRFLELNSDIAERYEIHKTYDILKDATRDC